MERLLELHHQKCIKDTRSCAKSVYRKPHTHCGACSQCIDRRFATLASQCQEYDPDQMYAIDIFKEELNNIHDKAMAVGFVGFANSLESMTVDNFVQKFSSDVHEIARYISNQKYEATLKSLFDLHYRHAVKVDKVMDAKCNENISLVRKGILPDNYLINMVLRGVHRDIKKVFKTGKNKTVPQKLSFRQDSKGVLYVVEAEKSWLEFKETLNVDLRTGKKATHAGIRTLEAIASFLNTDGGTVLIGVDDNGKIKGLDKDLKYVRKNNDDGFESKVRDMINNNLKPLPLQKISITFPQFKSVKICRIDIEKNDHVVGLDGDVFIRNGKRKLKAQEAIDYGIERKNKCE